MLKKINLNSKSWQWSILIILTLIWGSSFILIKRGLESFSGFQVGAIRIFFASLFLFPFFFKRAKEFKKSDLKSILTVAFLGNLFPAILFAYAQVKVSSSLSGMLNAVFPLTVLLIGILMYKVKILKSEFFGVFIGIIGSLGLVFEDLNNFFSDNYLYFFFILIGTIFYAVSLNEIKFKLSHIKGFTLTVFSFSIIGPISGILLLFSDFSAAVASPNFELNLFYIFLLGVTSSAIAMSIYYVFIEKVDIVFASMVTYLIPVVAIVIGLFDGENISILQYFSILIIFIGIYIVNRVSGKNPK